MENLQDKAVVITGAASGIGAAMVEVFGAAGARLVLADIDQDGLDNIGKTTCATDVVVQKADVTRPEDLAELHSVTQATFGGVDVLINNAGVACSSLVWEQSLADWNWILNVNLIGVVNGIREFLPQMINQGHGHIVNTASLAGLMTSQTLSAYCVSKYAVVALSECLRHDLALVGAPINVSVLCPGPVSSGIHLEPGRPVSTQEANPVVELVSDAIAAQMALGKSAQEIAKAALLAVLNNEFWALPDTEVLPNIKVRVDEIRQQSGLLF